MKSIKSILLTIMLTSFLFGCNNEGKQAKSEQTDGTTSEKVEELNGTPDVPVFSTTSTPQDFENGVGELVNEIEKSLQGVNPVEKKLTIFDQANTPVKIWFSEKDQQPIKIEQGEANDSGEFTGSSRYFFVNGDLWFSDQPFAKFIFESDKLKYWLDENWNINQIPEENLKSREENIKHNLERILK